MAGPSVGTSQDSEMLPSNGSAVEAVKPVAGGTVRGNTFTAVSEAGLAPMALRAATR